MKDPLTPREQFEVYAQESREAQERVLRRLRTLDDYWGALFVQCYEQMRLYEWREGAPTEDLLVARTAATEALLALQQRPAPSGLLYLLDIQRMLLRNATGGIWEPFEQALLYYVAMRDDSNRISPQDIARLTAPPKGHRIVYDETPWRLRALCTDCRQYMAIDLQDLRGQAQIFAREEFMQRMRHEICTPKPHQFTWHTGRVPDDGMFSFGPNTVFWEGSCSRCALHVYVRRDAEEIREPTEESLREETSDLPYCAAFQRNRGRPPLTPPAA